MYLILGIPARESRTHLRSNVWGSYETSYCNHFVPNDVVDSVSNDGNLWSLWRWWTICTHVMQRLQTSRL